MRVLKIILSVAAVAVVAAVTATFALSPEVEMGAASSVQYRVVAEERVPMPALIPQPKSVTECGGVLYLERAAKVSYGDVELKPLAHYVADHLGVEVANGEGAIQLAYDPMFGDEEYCITVGDDGVWVVGGGYGGVFNGVATLFEMLPSAVYARNLDYPVALPVCEVSDMPRWNHRGFMLDVCRTWMDKEVVKAYIDILAYHKVNSLRLHLTDDEAWRIEIESHPELAEYGGFRGGDSPIWPRYGKWNERWGGYYTKADMHEIIEYARVRNITIVPEIDLPGHSLCIATLHPEILCNYTPDTSRAFGYDVRSAFCASREENYALLSDILKEVCELFPSEYIHIGGDEVDMSQWRKCPDCQNLMREKGMSSTEELQGYFMSRLADILAANGKRAAVWNEAIDGGNLATSTRVYGWEGVKECRESALKGYPTVVMPGQYLYFDMKQSKLEPGHDWAAIFDWSKVYGFSLESLGFTAEEAAGVVGFEASFFSELYASHNPERADYLHYQTFPRLVAFAEVAWVDGDVRDGEAFYERMVAHYDRLDAMGVVYRLMPPKVVYKDGVLTASTDDGSELCYYVEPENIEKQYNAPIKTPTPAKYSFVARRAKAHSPVAAVAAHFKTITPKFDITSSMPDSERYSFDKAEGYGRLARTTRAADVGDWVMFTFESAVKCRRMVVATGNFQLPRYTFENGYVEVSYDGIVFERVGELDCGGFVVEQPQRAIKCVRITCTSRGNGAEWVSIQPPTIYPEL